MPGVMFKVKSAELSAATQRFIKAKQAAAEVVVIRVTTGLCSSLQVNTPVREGRARAGWSPAILQNGGARLVEGPNPTAVKEGRAAGEYVADFSTPLRPRATVTNGVRYIVDIMVRGRSPQVAAGAFQRVLSKWIAYLHKEAGKSEGAV